MFNITHVTQTCTWTGDCRIGAPQACVDKCVVNLWPLDRANPVLNGVAYHNDDFYGVCPEAALLVERARVGWPAVFANTVDASGAEAGGLVRSSDFVLRAHLVSGLGGVLR